MDGAQYLFTVRRDAQKLPRTTRVENPYNSPKRVEAAVPVVPAQLPSSEWRENFRIHFKQFRQNTSQPTIHVHIPQPGAMPPKKERDLWWAFLAGRPESDWKPVRSSKKSKANKYKGMREPSPDPVVEEEEEHEEEMEQEPEEEVWRVNEEGEVEQVRVGPSKESPTVSTTIYTPREPTPSLIHQIDHRMALHLLMYFTHWMNLHLRQPHMLLSASPSGLSESHARWMFSLLSKVDEFVSADDMHLLRNLARACIDVIKALRKVGTTTSASIGNSMSERACWTIFTLVADFWAQRDLWMDAESVLGGV